MLHLYYVPSGKFSFIVTKIAEKKLSIIHIFEAQSKSDIYDRWHRRPRLCGSSRSGKNQLLS